MELHWGNRILWQFLLCIAVFSLALVFIEEVLCAEVFPPHEIETTEIERNETLHTEPRVYSGDDVKGIRDRWSYFATIDVSYTLSDRSGSDTLSGGSIDGVLVPRYRFSDRLSFTLMYDANYYRKRDFYSDEVGPRERTEFQRHAITPMFRINFGEKFRYSVIPSFFYTRTYNKDVEGGDWDDGLYNYEDMGGGLDFSVGELGFGGVNGVLRLGVQYYKRNYPNFDSLLDLAIGLNVERDERDYHGILTKVGYNWVQESGFSWSANYYLLCKKLDSKKVVDRNGVLSSEEQRDRLHNLDLSLWYFPDYHRSVRVGLDVNCSVNESNQNYYDGMGTIIPSDDEFLKDFYDYTSYFISPNISYSFSLLPLTPSLAYSYQKLVYSDRRAQNSNGSYKSDAQYSDEHQIAFRLRYDLFDTMSLYVQWQYVDVRSNNDNQSVYEYNRTVNNYYIGVSYRF
ncbi:MAG: hypothetical protein SVW57_01790 [Thermodesulfobacteriota bacterium]|nr:hypothetical protein [Thermodesulfobacteriota bacterium]